MYAKRRAFTIMELMIVITIIGLLSLVVFVPYGFYGNLSKLRMSKSIIAQNLNLARNYSMGLINQGDSHNQNIALFFKVGSHSMKMGGYPYNHTGPITESSATDVKEVLLEDGININAIRDINGVSDSGAILFKAPDGIKEIYTARGAATGITITIGYKDVTSGMLSKDIQITR